MLGTEANFAGTSFITTDKLGKLKYGADIVNFVADSTVPQGLAMIRKLGTFVEFSVHASPVAVDWSIIGDAKELNIHGAHLGPYCYPKAIRYIHDDDLAG